MNSRTAGQQALIVERPPYYRPPRNRPVSFERPLGQCQSSGSTSGCCPKVQVYINHAQENYHHEEGAGRKPEVALPTYNNLPKPFSRDKSQYGYGGEFREQQAGRVPKILVNNQALYPTSTVHKSMLGGHSPAGVNETGTGSGPAYARLISPTPLTSYEPTSYEASSLSRSTNNELEQQQGSYVNQAGSSIRRPVLVEPTTRRRRGPNQLQQVDSNTVLPDSKRDEFMWDRQLERASIAHQNYRTLPIVLPKPKARHDLATGFYTRLSYDPTWDLALSKPASFGRREQAARRIQEALSGSNHLVQSIDKGAACPTCKPTSGLAAMERGSNSSSSSGANLSPAFNYREYIDSTRRAT